MLELPELFFGGFLLKHNGKHILLHKTSKLHGMGGPRLSFTKGMESKGKEREARKKGTGGVPR